MPQSQISPSLYPCMKPCKCTYSDLHNGDEGVQWEGEARSHVQGASLGDQLHWLAKSRENHEAPSLGHTGKEEAVCSPSHVCNPVGPGERKVNQDHCRSGSQIDTLISSNLYSRLTFPIFSQPLVDKLNSRVQFLPVGQKIVTEYPWPLCG